MLKSLYIQSLLHSAFRQDRIWSYRLKAVWIKEIFRGPVKEDDAVPSAGDTSLPVWGRSLTTHYRKHFYKARILSKRQELIPIDVGNL